MKNRQNLGARPARVLLRAYAALHITHARRRCSVPPTAKRLLTSPSPFPLPSPSLFRIRISSQSLTKDLNPQLCVLNRVPQKDTFKSNPGPCEGGLMGEEGLCSCNQAKTRSCCYGWAVNLMGVVLTGRGRLETRGDTGGRRPWEEGGRARSDAPTSQGSQEPADAGQGREEPSWGLQGACGPTDNLIRLLTSRTLRKHTWL